MQSDRHQAFHTLGNPAALAAPPFRPSATAAGFFPWSGGVADSSISPAEILPTMTAGARQLRRQGAARPLGPRGILVLDLAYRISGFAKSNQHSLGEVDTFFVTFRDLIPRRAVP